jgi:hypothetical protein
MGFNSVFKGLKVNDKEVTDKLEIASKFNTFYHAQHNLEHNQKKKEKMYRKQKGVSRVDGHLEELFTKEFSMEELKEAIKTLAIRSNQDMTKYS